MKKFNQGFTLIELLIVVMVIGVLAGVSLGIINPQQQKERASDSVRLRNIKSVAEGIESYNEVELNYPEEGEITNPNSLLYEVYLDEWPGDEYQYGNTGSGFILEVPNSLDGCYKYQSTWSQVMQCPSGECAVAGQSVTSSSASDCSQL